MRIVRFISRVSLLALVAIIVRAQDDAPECAKGCMASAATAVGCDSSSDSACVCSSNPYISSVRQCMDRACNSVDQEAGTRNLDNQCQLATAPPSSTPILTTTIPNPPETQTFTTVAPPGTSPGGPITTFTSVPSSGSGDETTSLTGGTGSGEGTGPQTGVGNGSGTGMQTQTQTGASGAETSNAAIYTRAGMLSIGGVGAMTVAVAVAGMFVGTGLLL